MLPVYDSRSSECRNPCGAVPSGTRVVFRAYPESHRFPLRGYLVAEYEALGRTREIPMSRLEQRGDRELFEAELDTSGYVGLVFYHFRFENDGGAFRYCAREGRTGGKAVDAGRKLNPFQLTVYSPAAAEGAPSWFGQGVTYQIFPDRFARSGKSLRWNTRLADGSSMRSRERIARRWQDDPDPTPELFDGKIQVTNRDFFGGNFAGIREKLDYLASLGVKTLYLNPIFESFSNHRYDTADYEKIDPLLGDTADFTALCEAAHALGMRVILDGVFNHTGADSRYFNRRGSYGEDGAYRSKDSKYYKWYNFKRWPDDYDSWWGMLNLPAVNESNPAYRRFICDPDDPNCIIRRWLRAGADGWRLDVADELPDDFIADIKAAALHEKPDAFILGEVWEDASNKISYDVRRRYILGVDVAGEDASIKNVSRETSDPHSTGQPHHLPALDAVMGYVFRNATLGYIQGGDAANFLDEMEQLRENYPPYATANAMNILGTHDTPRMLTLLGTPGEAWAGPKETHAHLRSTPELHDRAVALLKIASAIQFCYPGSPSVFYGDEAGLEGAEDPFCRRTFKWGEEDESILAHYRRLGAARSSYAALREGELSYIVADGGLLGFRRSLKPLRRNGFSRLKNQSPAGADRNAENDVLLVSNASESLQTAFFEPGIFLDLLTNETLVLHGSLELEPLTVRILVKISEAIIR